MSQQTSLIQNNCLKICIDKKKKCFDLNELINDNLLCGYTINEILNALKLMEISLFEIIESPTENTKVNIAISLKVCSSYTNYYLNCHDDKCNKLHICASKIKSTNKLCCICPLEHSIKSDHNKNLIKNCNILADYNIFLDFYQVMLYI